MVFLYNLILTLARLGLRVFSVFHPKAKAFVQGRKNLLARIQHDFQQVNDPVVWVHCSSLGEFEQGRPVIERLKREFPQLKILLTFFSPSGYEVRKNYNQADFIYYLPLDSSRNAKKFIAYTKPTLAIFVKYEFWYHYCKELHARKIPLISISAIFRKSQLFFHEYGGFMRNILKHFSFFFVQNDESVRLLKSIGIVNCKRVGDTRFDRVYQVVRQSDEIPIAKKFKGDDKVFVIGSSWQEDMDVLAPFINENRLKFIIAPHEVSESSIHGIEKQLQVKHIRYSQAADKNLDDFTALIIDNIGMLSRLYRYGEFAYVGGAYGQGLHNILEAACYGVPILFGNKNYEKFQEATDLINRGGAFDVSDYPDLKAKYEMLNVPESFLLACEVTRQYVEENLGATEKIMTYCRNIPR
ncbi:MAG TPA: glycosyltransferase N-terminal domain-containing protein [Ohtaekwangia sp.]